MRTSRYSTVFFGVRQFSLIIVTSLLYYCTPLQCRLRFSGGGLNVVVLEGRERVGGRLYSDDGSRSDGKGSADSGSDGCGYVVDMGGAWVWPHSQQAVMSLAKVWCSLLSKCPLAAVSMDCV
jgi:flavin-dependent amine oxidoreductase